MGSGVWGLGRRTSVCPSLRHGHRHAAASPCRYQCELEVPRFSRPEGSARSKTTQEWSVTAPARPARQPAESTAMSDGAATAAPPCGPGPGWSSGWGSGLSCRSEWREEVTRRNVESGASTGSKCAMAGEFCSAACTRTVGGG